MTDFKHTSEYTLHKLKNGFSNNFLAKLPKAENSLPMYRINKSVNNFYGYYHSKWRGKVGSYGYYSSVAELSYEEIEELEKLFLNSYDTLCDTKNVNWDTIGHLNEFNNYFYALCLCPTDQIEFDKNYIDKAAHIIQLSCRWISQKEQYHATIIQINFILSHYCYLVRNIGVRDVKVEFIPQAFRTIVSALDEGFDDLDWQGYSLKRFWDWFTHIAIAMIEINFKFSASDVELLASLFKKTAELDQRISHKSLIGFLSLRLIKNDQKSLKIQTEVLKYVLDNFEIYNVYSETESNYGWYHNLLLGCFLSDTSFDLTLLRQLLDLNEKDVEENIAGCISNALAIREQKVRNITSLTNLLTDDVLFKKNHFKFFEEQKTLTHLIVNLTLENDLKNLSLLFDKLYEISRYSTQIEAFKALSVFCSEAKLVDEIATKINERYLEQLKSLPQGTSKRIDILKLIGSSILIDTNDVDNMLNSHTPNWFLKSISRKLHRSKNQNPQQLLRWYNFADLFKAHSNSENVIELIKKRYKNVDSDLKKSKKKYKSSQLTGPKKYLANAKRRANTKRKKIAEGRKIPENIISDFGEPLLSLVNAISPSNKFDAELGRKLMSPIIEQRIADQSDADAGWVTIPDEIGATLSDQLHPIDGKYDVKLLNTAWRAVKLPWYDDVCLIQVHDPHWLDSEVFIYYLCDSKGNLFRLNGTSPPIHEVNAKAPIQLSEETAVTYLDFFCFFVRGEEGPFLVLHSPEQQKQFKELESKVYKEFVAANKPVTYDGKNENDHYLVSATISYSNAIFHADFAVQPTGMIEMLDDEPKLADLPFGLLIPVN